MWKLWNLLSLDCLERFLTKQHVLKALCIFFTKVRWTVVFKFVGSKLGSLQVSIFEWVNYCFGRTRAGGVHTHAHSFQVFFCSIFSSLHRSDVRGTQRLASRMSASMFGVPTHALFFILTSMHASPSDACHAWLRQNFLRRGFVWTTAHYATYVHGWKRAQNVETELDLWRDIDWLTGW